MIIEVGNLSIDKTPLITDCIMNILVDQRQAKIRFNFIDDDEVIPIYLAIVSVTPVKFSGLLTKLTASIDATGINMNTQRQFRISISSAIDKVVTVTCVSGNNTASASFPKGQPVDVESVQNLIKVFGNKKI